MGELTVSKKTKFVYLIQAGRKGPIKIGVARNVNARMCILQTGNHKELRLIVKLGPFTEYYAYKIEGLLHKKFSNRRIRGEWFTGVSMKYIESIHPVVDGH